MLKTLFGLKKVTTKSDLVLAVATAVVGVWKAIDTVRDYKTDNKKEEDK